MKMIKAIPVTLLTGFLGAGKTSYLNELLARGLPQGSLILVNDFGCINIDAELIEYSDERIMRLSNGCICCTLGGSLAERLAELLRMSPLPSNIYIEASGIANPARIADMVRVSPRLSLAEVICLIDAGQAERYSQDPLVTEVWHQQIRAASLLIINRLPPSLSLPPVLAQLLSRAPARVELLAGAPETAAVADRGQPPPRTIGSGRWHSFSLTFSGAIDGQRLAGLLQEYGDVLFRAKGMLLRRGRDKAEVLQLSGGRLNWSPVVKSPAKGQLVCIGAGGERMNQLARALNALNS
ncbi:CobW family GTP-binding protein [Zobellella aerophila]|uniref:GTP-binding protein n=1 Tax=Zobellella aerophila TaxID=870480 RepID=A0ABP6VZM1_9GAMM